MFRSPAFPLTLHASIITAAAYAAVSLGDEAPMIFWAVFLIIDFPFSLVFISLPQPDIAMGDPKTAILYGTVMSIIFGGLQWVYLHGLFRRWVFPLAPVTDSTNDAPRASDRTT